jgi:hypothetical protein
VYLLDSILRPRMHIALVTCAELPQLDSDARRLIAPLAARGIAATPTVWDDPNVDWARFDLAVIRSCWDYARRRVEFINWAASVPRLVNPPAVLAWNTHKRYLNDLSARGIATVETTWLPPGQHWSLPDGGEWVIKPAVSLAGLDSGRYRLHDPDERLLAADHVRRLHADDRVVMMQPYMRTVDEEDETALVYFGGVFSHAMRKAAVLTGPDIGIDRRFQPQGGLTLRPHQPTPNELAAADRALAAVPCRRDELLYARVDLVTDHDGRCVLMELELTEPQLYLGRVPVAADRMAAVIERRASSTRAVT